MAQIEETFCTSVGCMDGRSECAVAKWGREKFGVQYIDAITEAGTVGLLIGENVDQLLESVQKKVLISIEKHRSKGIIVSGHQECAGNSVPDNVQKDEVRKVVSMFQDLFNFSLPILGVFVKRSEKDPSQWVVEEVPQTMKA